MFNFILPNGKILNTDDVAEALVGMDGQEAYLDIETGNVEWLLDPDSMFFDSDDEEMFPIRKKVDDEFGKRHFAIEALPSWQQYKWMESFVEDIFLLEPPNNRFSIKSNTII